MCLGGSREPKSRSQKQFVAAEELRPKRKGRRFRGRGRKKPLIQLRPQPQEQNVPAP